MSTENRTPIVAASAVVVAALLFVPVVSRASVWCKIEFSLEDDISLGALQFRADYSAASGEFFYEGSGVACSGVLFDGMTATYDDDGAQTLRWAGVDVGGNPGPYVDFDGIDGPRTVARCEFGANVAPDPASFAITVEDAVAVESVSGSSRNVCGAPETGSTPPFSRDAYVILRKAVGHSVSCDLCECDTDNSGAISATDVARSLRNSVGGSAVMTCPPCAGLPSTGSVTAAATVAVLPRCIVQCPETPSPDCGTGAKSSFKLFQAENPANDSFKWKLSGGPATDQAELGDPTTSTSYKLCVYDSTGGVDSLVGEYEMEAGGFWTNLDPRGVSYGSQNGVPYGVRRALVKTGDVGESKFLVNARGSNLYLMPADSSIFNQGPRVVVQLRQTATEKCWSTEFTTNKINTLERFAAKNP